MPAQVIWGHGRIIADLIVIRSEHGYDILELSSVLKKIIYFDEKIKQYKNTIISFPFTTTYHFLVEPYSYIL